jgi:hypothetical protein
MRRPYPHASPPDLSSPSAACVRVVSGFSRTVDLHVMAQCACNARGEKTLSRSRSNRPGWHALGYVVR